MANFSPSNLVAGQAVFSDKFKSGEWRVPDIAACQTAVKSEVANPLLADLRRREDRSVTAYFPVRQAATDGTARAHDHAGARGDSLGQAITWSTYSEPFSVSLKQADNNVLSWSEQYAASLKNAIFNLLNRVDAAFVAALLADKTGVNVGGGNGSFDEADDDFQINAGSYSDTFYQEVKTMLSQNLYRGPIMGIVDSKAKVLADKNAAQGGANASNLQFQFMGYDDIVHTTREVLDPDTYQASGIFFEAGLVGFIPWIPVQNRKPLDAEKAMSYVGDYGQISIPELGVNFAIHSYADRADTTSSNGRVQDVVLYQEVSIDFGYVSAPLGTFRGADDSVVYTAGLIT